MWTRFMDMHSGGGTKEKPYEYIYIEAPEQEAEIIFFNRFGHNPNRITCSCCGADYSIDEHKTLKQATGYERGCAYKNNRYVEKQDDSKYSWRKYQTLQAYLRNHKEVLVVRKSQIKREERVGEVPQQGYVWMD